MGHIFSLISNHLIPKLFADVVVVEGRTALRLVVAIILKALH